MRNYGFVIVIFLYVFLTGCAHNINITPEISKIDEAGNTQPLPSKVGYYFEENREKEVITPGGGGDKVKYKPYKDIETGFYKMLTNVFDEVHAIDSIQDEDVVSKDLDYLIGLRVVTNSGSSSAFTWPPTSFSVDLTCKISDSSGAHQVDVRAIGQGEAEYSEFKSEFSLAAKRAANDALIKMQDYLLTSAELRSDTSPGQSEEASESKPKSKQTASEQLKDLKRLYDKGLINKEVYEERQRAILGTF